MIGQHAFPMEKQAALAVPEEKKGMTIWNSTQGHDFCRAKRRGFFAIDKCKWYGDVAAIRFRFIVITCVQIITEKLMISTRRLDNLFNIHLMTDTLYHILL